VAYTAWAKWMWPSVNQRGGLAAASESTKRTNVSCEVPMTTILPSVNPARLIEFAVLPEFAKSIK
jgi:hypothetical protein